MCVFFFLFILYMYVYARFCCHCKCDSSLRKHVLKTSSITMRVGGHQSIFMASNLFPPHKYTQGFSSVFSPPHAVATGGKSMPSACASSTRMSPGVFVSHMYSASAQHDGRVGTGTSMAVS